MRGKKLPKLAAAMLMLALVFSAALAVPAFADDLAAGTRSTTTQTYMTDTSGWYTQGAESTYSTNQAVNVTVTIEDKVSSAAAIDYVQIPVTLPAVPAGKAYTVRDALIAVNNSQSTYKFLDTYGNEIDTGDHYFKYVQYNSTNYGPSNDTVTYDGWCFRINGRMPLESGTASSSPIGAAISNAYITDGQQVNVYFDDLYDSLKEDRFTKIASASDDGETLTVNVKFTYDWFTPISYAWHLYDYENYGSALAERIPVRLLDANGETLLSGNTGNGGLVTFNLEDLDYGTYTIYAVGQTASFLGGHAQTSDKVTYVYAAPVPSE